MLKSTLLTSYSSALSPQKSDTKYVYHIRQKNMEGETLYPLSRLKDQNPNAYAAASRKYEGREHVLAAKVSASDGALWNDHLFFSPIDPADMLKKWIELGYDTKRFDGLTYYKIPVSRLQGQTTLCFEYLTCDKPGDVDVMNSETTRIDINEYAFPETIRESTMQYWKNSLISGQQPLLFCGIPHILVRGSVNIQGCEIFPLLSQENLQLHCNVNVI